MTRPRWAGLVTLLAAAGLQVATAEGGPGPAAEPPVGMVLIPAGEFTMGRTFSTSDDETGMRPLILRDDRPAHAVRLHAYWMDSAEVTHSDYAGFIAETGRKAPYHWLGGAMPADLAEHPIYNVAWNDANAYCAWRGKRLPTEAEWERAARGGLDGANFPWGRDKPDRDKARYSTPEGPAPGRGYSANPFGLYDMAGGVSEWCRDWFEREYYPASPSENPQGPAEGMYKIVRGGAWSDGPNRITVFFRNWARPNQQTPNLGFRCVQDVP